MSENVIEDSSGVLCRPLMSLTPSPGIPRSVARSGLTSGKSLIRTLGRGWGERWGSDLSSPLRWAMYRGEEKLKSLPQPSLSPAVSP